MIMMMPVPAIAAILFSVFFFSAGWYLSVRVSNPPRILPERVFADEAEKGNIDLSVWNALRKDIFTVRSAQNHDLHCIRVFSDAEKRGAGGTQPKKVLIVCHGYGFNYVGSLKYIAHFLALGFDTVLYDHRNSGLSGGNKTTMGFFEKDDLSLVIEAVQGMYGLSAGIGTLGESMGGATVILQACSPNPPDFVIADCAFSDLRAELALRLKIENRLPPFPFIPLASLATKIRAGYFYGQVSPLRAIRECGGLPDVPMLFMHGGSDDYIPLSMSAEMHEAKKGIKGFTVIPGAGHGISAAVDPVLYMRSVDEFLEKVYT